jgi:hypothetical protein
MKRKIFLSTVGLIVTLAINPVSAFAQTNTANQQNLAFMQNVDSQLKSFESQNPQYVSRAGIVITGINGSTITGTQTNKKKGTTVSYTINAGSAIVVRKFWGQSSLSQVSIGDRIRVIGTWTDSSKTAINAFLVRDMSIQDRSDRFGGTVSSLGNNSFTFQSKHRGSWTVTVTSQTKITGKKKVSMQFSNINVNDKLRVAGTFDRTGRVITATSIRDMSFN